jgi:hypothetical protein
MLGAGTTPRGSLWPPGSSRGVSTSSLVVDTGDAGGRRPVVDLAVDGRAALVLVALHSAPMPRRSRLAGASSCPIQSMDNTAGGHSLSSNSPPLERARDRHGRGVPPLTPPQMYGGAHQRLIDRREPTSGAGSQRVSSGDPRGCLQPLPFAWNSPWAIDDAVGRERRPPDPSPWTWRAHLVWGVGTVGTAQSSDDGAALPLQARGSALAPPVLPSPSAWRGPSHAVVPVPARTEPMALRCTRRRRERPCDDALVPPSSRAGGRRPELPAGDLHVSGGRNGERGESAERSGGRLAGSR